MRRPLTVAGMPFVVTKDDHIVHLPIPVSPRMTELATSLDM